MRSTINLGVILLSFFASVQFSALKAQVNANFSASETSGCGLVQSIFTDLSTSTSGTINSWSWDFGSSQSSLPNPGYTFSSSGFHTVCLTVMTTTGASDTECKTNFIEVFSLPDPDFSATPRVGCVPLDVTFLDLTSSTAPIVSYIWGVGGVAGVIQDDGSLPSIQNTYENEDTYTISLTVQDANGCSNSVSKPGYIDAFDNPQIDVSPSSTFSCDPPLFVSFSNNFIEPNTTYDWDFGNGQTFQGNTPGTVVYTSPGLYSVTVNALSDAGCASQLVLPDVIKIGNPIMISSNVQTICLGEAVQFNDDSEDPADNLTWDFGDGNTSNNSNPSHTYVTPGCYSVSIEREINGCINSETLGYCIDVRDNPSGNFGVSNSLGCTIPHTVNINSNLAPGVTVSWDFGDGNFGTGTNPSHDYNQFGTFEIIPTITNIYGCSTELPAQIVKLEATQARLATQDNFGCKPLSLVLAENSASVVPIANWIWEIIDNGSIPPVIFSSTAENPFVTIPDTGIYDIKLTVTNTLGCSDTKLFSNSIAVGIKPVADFSFMPDSACRKQEVSFVDNSSSYTNEWIWDFGDGDVSYDQNPNHNYNDVGFFTVQLISINNGCADTISRVDIVEILDPDAKFRTDLVCDNFNLRTFINTSKGSDLASWDFGVSGIDTDTSSLDSIAFTFPGPGVYNTRLIVENLTTGCLDTINEEINITNLTPVIEIMDSTGCAPFELQITNTSNDAISYSWTAPGAMISEPDSLNPGIIYESAGVYTDVELTVEDTNGCIENMILPTPIQVSELVPDIMPSSMTGCAGSPIDFLNGSTSTYHNIISSEWQMGDGSDTLYSTDVNHTYNEAGYFSVSLKVQDDGGCESILVLDSIDITNPIAKYKSAKYSCTFAPLKFLGRGVGQGLTYSWDFGDGGTAGSRNPSHLYAAEGQYQVCLTVTDRNGCVADTCGLEEIIVLDPVAGFSVDNNYQPCPPMLANFINNSVNAINYEWEFGDNSGESDLEAPPHVYTDPGSYDVMLIASTSDVCTDTLLIPDYILLEGPIGDFEYTVHDNCAPGDVTFVANSLDAYDFFWDYGDGNIDTTLNVDYDSLIYDYNNIGVYRPKLILVDNANCQRVLELPDSIVMTGFNYDFNASDTLFCGNSALTTDFSFDGQTSAPLQESYWNFPGSDTPTTNDDNPSITYNTPGEYDVQLILDNGACRDTITKENFIKVGAIPDAQMDLDVDQGCAPFDINFTDQSTVSNGTVSSWNWDFQSAGNSMSQNPVINFDTPGTITVNLEVISDIGCIGINSREVDVFEPPTAGIIGETNICIGEQAQLSANVFPGNGTELLLWSGGPFVGCDDCEETVVNPVTTTTYDILVTDVNGCTAQESYEVYVRSVLAPVIDLGSDTSVCKEASIILNLEIDQTGTSISWDQNSSGLSCYSNCPNPSASPTNQTTYYVLVQNVDGCKAIDSITVDLIDDDRDFLGDDLTICQGNDVQLMSNYGSDPIWQNNAFLSCLDCPDPMVNPSEETIFYLEVKSENNCLIKDSVIVYVQEPMEVEAGPDILACVGAGADMQAVGIGIPTWSPSNGLNNVNDLNAHVQPQVTTMYTLTLDDGVCLNSDSVLVEIIETAEVFTSGGTICYGDTFNTEAEGIADLFTWVGPSGPLEQGMQFEIAAIESSQYQVIAEMNGCEPDTAFFDVVVNEIPEMEYPETVSILPGFSGQIKPREENLENLEFTWTPALGLSCSSCPDPIAAPDTTTTYRVDIFNPATGCTSTEEVKVRLRSKCGEDLIVLPNAFSPNSDGRNDEFKILASQVESIESFSIFDRWGNVHFKTDNLDRGWNGVFNGKKVNPGVYVYLIEAVCPIDGSTFYKKGDVTILR